MVKKRYLYMFVYITNKCGRKRAEKKRDRDPGLRPV